jgi:hypothetical protein
MLTLQRVRKRRQTLGVLRVETEEGEDWTCCTLELPWRDNSIGRSCIPPGPGQEPVQYQAKKHESPTFGDTLWLPGLSQRSEILVHAGNYVSDTRGCILVGRSFVDIDGDSVTDVTESKATLRTLLGRLPEEVEITIGWSGQSHPADLEGVGHLSVDLQEATAHV